MREVKQLMQYDELGQFRGKEQGIPKIEYLKKLVSLTLTDLSKESYKTMKKWYITRKKKYHWRMNACYFECLRRGKQKMFHRRFSNLKYEKIILRSKRKSILL